MIEPCQNMWDISFTCDVSNIQTMAVEIIIAMILASIAIIIAVSLYFKEKKQSSDLEELLRSSKKTIDEIKPIILKQGDEIKRNHKKEKIRKDNGLEKISYWITLAKQNLLSTKKIFQEMHDVTESVKILHSYHVGSKHMTNQIELSLQEISDLLTLDEIKKIEHCLGMFKAYNGAIETISERNYQDIKDTFPFDTFSNEISELLKDLPDPNLHI